MAILAIMGLSSLIIGVTCIINFSEIMKSCGCEVQSQNDFKTYSIMQMVTFAVSGIGYSTIYYLFWIFATPIKIGENDLGPLTNSELSTSGVTPGATPGGPEDILDYLKEHLHETKRKHRRGTFRDHQAEVDNAYGYKGISQSTESLPQLIQRPNTKAEPLLGS